MLLTQGWYLEQMRRNGLGSMTFELEVQADGVTPVIHVVGVDGTDAFVREEPWTNTLTGAQQAGLGIWNIGEDWVLVSEAHEQQSDGSVIGGFFGGASWGIRYSGTVLLGGDTISRFNSHVLTDTRPYDGLVLTGIGPYPLVQNVSFPYFEQDTLSSISSSAIGGLAHELGHTFALFHDFRNDNNFSGNVMGNGLRGIRGSVFPDLFPEDDTRLAYTSALALQQSRFFNPQTVYTETEQPVVSITTSGVVDPVDGQLHVSFEASDASGLTLALLHIGGDTVASMPLTGTVASDTFVTPWYAPGVEREFRVTVYDSQGNIYGDTAMITPASGFNGAPKPYIRLDHSLAVPGQDILLDASRSSDPDGDNQQMTVEWDLDGDGVFDTPPATDITMITSFEEVGTRLIYARLTDASGAASVSAPVSLRVMLAGDLNDDGFVGIEDLNIVLGAWNQQVIFGDRSAGDSTWDGFVGIEDLNVVLGNWNAGSYRAMSPADSVGPAPEPTTFLLLLLTGLPMIRRPCANCPELSLKASQPMH